MSMKSDFASYGMDPMKRLRWAGILTAIVVGFWLIESFDARVYVIDMLDWIDGLGAWGPVAMVLLTITGTVLVFPGWTMTVGAGVLFGLGWGLLWGYLGAYIGVLCAFLVSRHLVRGWVTKYAAKDPRFAAVDASIGEEGFKVVFLTRLSPAFPYNVLNYALGATRVSFWDYATASFVGMIPGTLFFVYMGTLAGDLATMGFGVRVRSSLEWVITLIGLVATIVVTVYIHHLAKTALEKQIGSIEPEIDSFPWGHQSPGIARRFMRAAEEARQKATGETAAPPQTGP